MVIWVEYGTVSQSIIIQWIKGTNLAEVWNGKPTYYDIS